MDKQNESKKFSDQIEGILNDRADPGDDPLLSLAGELADPPQAEPSPAFTRRLRHKLRTQAQNPRRRKTRPALRWSLIGIALTALLALTLILVWSPGAPTAETVLARAAEAAAIESGQILHIVAQTDGQNGQPRLFESWSLQQIGPCGSLTAVRSMTRDYAPGDTQRTTPVGYYYQSTSPFARCWQGAMYDAAFGGEQDDQGCAVNLYPVDASLPENRRQDQETRQEWTARLAEQAQVPAGGGIVLLNDCENADQMGLQAGESYQVWIERLRQEAGAANLRQTSLDGQSVYELTTQFEQPLADLAAQLEQQEMLFQFTMHFDRETYLPVRLSFHIPELGFQETIRFVIWEVLDPQGLDVDPFRWPPE